jgi:glutathione S-transferase
LNPGKTMLRLYFWPMACSLARRVALLEAGIEAR